MKNNYPKPTKKKRKFIKIDRTNTDPEYWNRILANEGLGVTRVIKGK